MAQQIIIKGTPVVAANEVLVADSNSKIPAVDGSAVTTMSGGNITGTIPTARLDTGTTANKLVVLTGSGLPAVDGSLLTGIVSHTTSASDPTISTNPSGGVGTEWINSTSGKQFICTDATAGENVWTCSGGSSGDDIVPIAYFGDRGCFPGGYPDGGPNSNVIDYVAIPTLGNAVDFGDLTYARQSSGSCSNGARGLCGGGQGTVTIDYFTFSTLGNAADFGDILNGGTACYGPAVASNGTRGIFFGGTDNNNNKPTVIEYVTIATLGDSADFGNGAARTTAAPMSSLTRALFAGGVVGAGNTKVNTIEYITVANTGNATDFGDLTQTKRHSGGTSNLTRGIVAGGTTGSNVNVMEYVTIATPGNATDFGDLTAAKDGPGGNSNATRGLFGGGSYLNNIDYVTIATIGNATDFGDLTVGRTYAYGCSGD